MLCSGLLSFCRIVIRTVLDLATPLATVAVTVLADQDRHAYLLSRLVVQPASRASLWDLSFFLSP